METKDKSLKDKAIKIQGKDYVTVAERILFFNETYPEGSITTELLSKPEDDRIVVRATVHVPVPVAPPQATGVVTGAIGFYRGQERTFTGHAQEKVGDGYINKTSALENAETSAVGRALAMMGIGVIESIASVDEITKAKNRERVVYDAANDTHIEMDNRDLPPFKGNPFTKKDSVII